MSVYKECPYCGAHLDPGERCDCKEAEERQNAAGKEKEVTALCSDPNTSTPAPEVTRAERNTL